MSSKIKLKILIGAKSDEYQSCLTIGDFVFNNVNRDKYEISTVRVSKDGENWMFPKEPGAILPIDLSKAPSDSYETVSIGQAIDRMKQEKIDVVFLACPGGTGENGSFQGLMQAANLKYTSSGVLASALAMDKQKSADLYNYYGLRTPKTLVFSRKDWKNPGNVKSEVEQKLGFPCFAKPNSNGSSVGVGLIKTVDDLDHILPKAFERSPLVLVQENIKGRELTCAVMDDGINEPMPFTPTETILLQGEFYTYEDKHVNEHSIDELNPAPLSEEMTKRVQEVTLTAHRALGCAGLSRTDMILTDKDELVVLETNTIPGMTPASVYLKIVGNFGMTIQDFFDRIISSALTRELD